MKSIRYIFSLLLLLLGASAAVAATPTASELVDAAAAKMRAAKSVTASFIASGTQGGQMSKGTFTISGNRFAIDSPEAKVWYDGQTQWTWSSASGEVNITEPTIEEIAQVNPYAIINSLRSRYKARYLGNPSQRTVVLTPSMPDPTVMRAEITFGADSFPSRMKLRMSSGEDLAIRITSVKTGGELPVTTFRFVPSKAPGAEIIDLR